MSRVDDTPHEIDEQQFVKDLLERNQTSAAGSKTLEKEIIWASLSGLGHNDRGLVVYTTCALSSLSLSNIEALSGYPFLQRVVLDNNHLTTLQPLQHAPSLLSVSAAYNKLDQSVFKHLRASSSTLEKLDLSFNQLTSLDGVGAFPYLTEFHASNNAIKSITRGQLEGLRSLSEVVLQENHIGNVDADAFRKCRMRHLNLSKNEITDLKFVLRLQETLATLNVADNNVMHFEPIVHLTLLSTLDLSGNNIYDQTELLMLAKVPTLREVGLIGNPLCSLSHGIHDVLDDDAASDVVLEDVPPPKKDNAAEQEAARKTIVPAPISKERAAPPVVDQSPEEEDSGELNQLSLEQQYRLLVLWKAPNIYKLDGVNVTPEELTLSKNLKGGADRTHRQEVKSKFLIGASGSAANSLRKSKAA
jgi:Leucine-rich repeat (LRR) protein